MPLPACAPDLSPAIREGLLQLGRNWAADPDRPRIPQRTLDEWAALLEAWIARFDLPLLVRKHRQNRGSLIESVTGRRLVPADNSPAQWAFAVAHDGYCPSLDEVPDLLTTGRLPVAMALGGGSEKASAVFRGLLGRCPNTGAAGWKLAHLESVGLGGRGEIAGYGPEAIERHFRLFLSPSNMFVVPAEWGGLAEVDEFLKGFRDAANELNNSLWHHGAATIRTCRRRLASSAAASLIGDRDADMRPRSSSGTASANFNDLVESSVACGAPLSTSDSCA